MDSHLQHKRLLYKIANDYYINNLTQDQIARRLGLSRIKVSRLLKRAREENIVTITLKAPSGMTDDLEAQIERKYGIEEAVVVATETSDDQALIAKELAPAAAACFLRRINGNEIISVAWGRTIMAVIDALPSRAFPDVHVVQMIGGLGSVVTSEHIAEITRKMAAQFSATLHLLPAPGIVSDAKTAEILKQDSQIAQTLTLASKADILIAGVGVDLLVPDSPLLRDGSILTQQDIRSLKKAGAVGDIVLHYIDKDGRPIEHEVNRRIIGLSFDQLRHIPCVIIVAGGSEKFTAIRAALLSGIMQVFITDQWTAQKLVQES
jgi:DNA-binding transcriptional regulator LsrR (DeoR family)